MVALIAEVEAEMTDEGAVEVTGGEMTGGVEVEASEEEEDLEGDEVEGEMIEGEAVEDTAEVETIEEVGAAATEVAETREIVGEEDSAPVAP